jgi:hypothetical protein
MKLFNLNRGTPAPVECQQEVATGRYHTLVASQEWQGL